MLSTSRNVPQGTQNEAQSAKNIVEAKFQFYFKPISNTWIKEEWTLKDAYNYITMDMGAVEETQKLRAIDDEKKAKAYKAKHFDYACFSGTFTKRDDAGLQNHSGLLCIDFDHICRESLYETRGKLLQDPYFETWLLFVSPSGDGLKWVIDIDLTRRNHSEWFDAISRYLAMQYGLIADPQCRNVSRACFLPHDGCCFANKEILKQEGCVPF